MLNNNSLGCEHNQNDDIFPHSKSIHGWNSGRFNDLVNLNFELNTHSSYMFQELLEKISNEQCQTRLSLGRAHWPSTQAFDSWAQLEHEDDHGHMDSAERVSVFTSGKKMPAQQ